MDEYNSKLMKIVIMHILHRMHKVIACKGYFAHLSVCLHV
jgi:hypothetical protein